MNDYKLKQMEGLKEAIAKCEAMKNDYESLPYETSAKMPYYFKYNFNQTILRLKATLKVMEHYKEVVGDNEDIKIGKYLSFGVSLYDYDNSIGGTFYFADDEAESKLYDNVFGSHSGINEFFFTHFIPIISAMLGNTNYSHAFGSRDLTDIMNFFKRFGYKSSDKKELLWDIKEFDNHVKIANNYIDLVVELSKNESVVADIDKLIGTWLEITLRRNNEE